MIDDNSPLTREDVARAEGLRSGMKLAVPYAEVFATLTGHEAQLDDLRGMLCKLAVTIGEMRRKLGIAPSIDAEPATIESEASTVH